MISGERGEWLFLCAVSARVGDLRFLFPGVLPKLPPAGEKPGGTRFWECGGGGMRQKRLVSLIYISFLVQLLGLTSSTFRYLPRRSLFALGCGREYLPA